MSFECWIFSHFIWSHRIAASLGKCSLHPSVAAVCVIPSHLNSSHVFWVFSPHLISSHPIWCLLSLSQLFSADHNCSHLFSCHLSFSHLFSSHLSLSQLFSFSQLFSSSPQLMYISCVLISSLRFSHLLSSSHIYSADLSSCQLVSPHLSSCQRTLKSSHLFSGPKPAPKTDLGAKTSKHYAFHIEDLTQRR